MHDAAVFSIVCRALWPEPLLFVSVVLFLSECVSEWVGDVVVSVGGVCVGVNECKSVFQYVLHT